MGIFDGILGGQGGLTTTTTNTTNPAQQAGGWNAVHPSQLQNMHGNVQILHNPQTWSTTSLGQTQGGTYWVQELKDEVAELRYILQRTVENYEELQAQHKALLDITKAGENR
jgi:hypothetical protein